MKNRTPRSTTTLWRPARSACASPRRATGGRRHRRVPLARPTRRKRSVTPTRTGTRTRTPVSSRYNGAVIPYPLRSPGSKSGISYSDIDRWRTATVGGSDFTYSTESSISQSSVTTSSVVSSSRARTSRIDSSSRLSTASGSRQLKAPSIASRPPHLGIHHDSAQICEHCHRPPHQIHGRTDVLPALRLEPHSAFLAAYRLSRLSCPEALERSTTLDPDDPFTIPPGLSERPNIPPHLLPELPAGERRARRLALLLDSDDPDVRDWAQAEYLKLGHVGRRLVREGVFEVKITPYGADENPPEDWSANEREEDLEKLRERLEREKERREEGEEVEREMVWVREMFGKWLIDGRVDGVFRLAAGVLNELLKEVARDEGEEWVAEDGAEDQQPESAKDDPKSRGPSSTLGASKTPESEKAAPMHAASAASVASSKRGGKQPSEPAQEERECEPEAEPKPEPEREPTPPPAADPEAKPEEPIVEDPPLVESINGGTSRRARRTRGAPREQQRCATCASCVTRVEQLNASTSRRARRTRGAPRGQLPRRHHGDLRDLASCVTCAKQSNSSTSWRARTMRGAPREQQPRRHHGDLRVVRHPCQATEREHIAAGTKNAGSSQGAAATKTSRDLRVVRRPRGAPREQPPRRHRADLRVVRRLRRPNASTSWRARRTRGAPREQPPRRHRGDLRNLRVVSPAPSEQTQASRTASTTA